ncbi:unnamed protein product [Pieris macdunnoughi]|uniref:Uncharacterized protein n=1 Tax=Pieris macdunnoughi TaxID=345717 RepID=A0A821X725_9NEOP|nr:unnamed protein product [Pieris macdunnoughi]
MRVHPLRLNPESLNYLDLPSAMNLTKRLLPLAKYSYVITELLQSDLHKIIVSPQHLSADHIKVFLYQILRVKQAIMGMLMSSLSWTPIMSLYHIQQVPFVMFMSRV